MNYSEIKTGASPILNTIISYALIVYIFVILGRAIWYNWELNQQIKKIERQIVEAEKENKNFQNLILYYQSDSFKEVEARKKLGLKKPGETAVSVPNQKFDNFNDELNAQKQNFTQVAREKNKKNYQLWLEFLFH